MVPMNQANMPGSVQAIMLGSAIAAITVAKKKPQVISVIKKYLGVLIVLPPSINHIAKLNRRTLL